MKLLKDLGLHQAVVAADMDTAVYSGNIDASTTFNEWGIVAAIVSKWDSVAGGDGTSTCTLTASGFLLSGDANSDVDKLLLADSADTTPALSRVIFSTATVADGQTITYVYSSAGPATLGGGPTFPLPMFVRIKTENVGLSYTAGTVNHYVWVFA